MQIGRSVLLCALAFSAAAGAAAGYRWGEWQAAGGATGSATPEISVGAVAGHSVSEAAEHALSAPRPLRLPNSVRALQAPDSAKSVSEGSAGGDAAVLDVITRELPSATPDERRVWLEQLRDLPLSDVREMLRVRRELADFFTTGAVDVPSPAGDHLPADVQQSFDLAGEN